MTAEQIDPTKPLDDSVLSGQWFHSWKTETPCGCNLLHWQGMVLAEASLGLYLVQLYEFVGGTPNIRRLVSVQEMLSWTLYESSEVMNNAYDQYSESGRVARHFEHGVVRGPK